MLKMSKAFGAPSQREINVPFAAGQARPSPPASQPMPPKHHPSAQALADFLTGDCSPGTALLVARHIGLCPKCRSRVQQMGAAAAAASQPPQAAWRALAPGVELARLEGVSGLGEAVYAIRAESGAQVPVDAPLRMSEILILFGGFEQQGKAYGAGDFVALDDHPAAPLTAAPHGGFSGLLTAIQPEGDHADF